VKETVIATPSRGIGSRATPRFAQAAHTVKPFNKTMKLFPSVRKERERKMKKRQGLKLPVNH
jgi:hypothetical protein